MTSKLKMPLTQAIGIFSLMFLITLIAEDQINGTANVFWFWGGAFIVWEFVYGRRTNLPSFYIMGVLGGTAIWHYLLATRYDTALTLSTWLVHMFILAGIGIYFVNVRIGRHAALEKNAFRLFKLASKNVWDTTNGFTSRPYPGRSVSADRKEINSFAGFMDSYNIAKAIERGNATYLIFSMHTSPVSNPPEGLSLEKVSYVMFDNEGNMAVSISQDDYKQYKEEYNFEQLCSSLNEIFADFFDLFRAGKEYSIKEKLNSTKLNPFN